VSGPRQWTDAQRRSLHLGIAALILGASLVGAIMTALLRRPRAQGPQRLGAQGVPIDRSAHAAGDEPAPARTETASSTPRTEPSPSSRASQLAEERRLLDFGRADLAQDEPDRALTIASVHQARYPNGALSDEREAIAIQALVAMQRYDEARARAKLFRERAPDSPLRPEVESTLRSIVPLPASP
jgi:hypothetical protein